MSSGGETESSGGLASSHSERYSDYQEEFGASPSHSSSNQAHLPEVSPNALESHVHETVRSLTEKLSAAFLNISAKEDLVKQHAKVAEEAVAGWEQAEAEVVTLKQQLEATVEKNSALQDKINELDEALKECVRQLRQSGEDREEKRASKCYSSNLALQKEIAELKAQLQDALSKSGPSNDHSLQSKLEAAEKENMTLKMELAAQYKNLKVLSFETELSNQAAETASKQHLESIKKVGRLEAECRRLRSLTNRFSSTTNQKPISHSACIESLTDSHSDSGERLLSVDTEPECSDSWANALIAELDQFKHKDPEKDLTRSVEIDLMDDFLEMERLVALPEADYSSSSIEEEADSDKDATERSLTIVETDVTTQKLIKLEEQVHKLESEKMELESALANSESRLEATCSQLNTADNKLLELQAQLDLAVEMKQAVANELTTVDARRIELESQLQLALENVEKLRMDMHTLEQKVENENALSIELALRLESAEAAKKDVEKLHMDMQTLEHKIENEKALSIQLASTLENAEAAKMALEAQLEAAQLDSSSLRRTLGLLESQLELGKELTSEIASKLDASELARNALESQLEDANLKVERFHKKVGLLEVKAEEDRVSAIEAANKLAMVNAERQELEFQLSTAKMETERLKDKIDILEGKISREKALSSELAANCHKLESQLSKIKIASEQWQSSISNDAYKMKQEKELAVAAEKLVECQKTIASLGLQLKSLTTFDELMIEAEKLEMNGGLSELLGTEINDYSHKNFSEVTGSISALNCKENGSTSSAMLAASPSKFSGFTRLLSRRVDIQ